MIKRIVRICLFIILLIALTQVDVKIGGTGLEDDILSDIQFIDDVGNKITVKSKIKSIVSLSPTHTENLYEIGVGEMLIGVDENSIYPFDVTKLPRYRLNKIRDIEAIIKSNPDLILIEPTMNQNNNSLVSMLETAGIKVVSLMPENIDEFDGYIKKLGILVDKKDVVLSKLETYNNELDKYKRLSNDVLDKKTVFVEASENGYSTVLEDSLVGRAIKLSGANLLTPKTKWYNDEENIIFVGDDYILSQKDNIDVYITLKGRGYSGASIISINQKENFSLIEAVKNNNIYEVAVPLVGQYTFRYLDGISEMKRLIYGSKNELSNNIKGDKQLNRLEFSTILFEVMCLPVFTITDRDYYDFEKFHHTYGAFEDVKYFDEHFNIIETVTMFSYIQPIEIDGLEYFNKKSNVTIDDLKHFIYIAFDLRNEELDIFLEDANIHLSESITKNKLIRLLKELNND